MNAKNEWDGRYLRICYFAGPGDVVGTYRHWLDGRDDPSEMSQTYSGEFYNICRRLGCAAYVIASHPRKERLEDGRIVIEHRPTRFTGTGGLWYHALAALYTLGLIITALRFRAHVVVAEDIRHWFILALLKPLGITVIPSLHCTLWPRGNRPRGVNALLSRLNALYLRRCATAVLAVSDEIIRQVRDGRHARVPLLLFRPVYPPDLFLPAPAPPPQPPFRVCYAGRIERDKGVFDLIEAGRLLAAAGRSDVEFHVCGGGGAVGEFNDRVSAAGLSGTVYVHGKLGRSDLLDIYRRSHCVIVPTTSEFAEGLNRVVFESIMAGRPVVATDICPAVDYFGEEVTVVPAGEVGGLVGAIIGLVDEPTRYQRLSRLCSESARRLQEPGWGMGEVLLRALRGCGRVDADWQPTETMARPSPGSYA